MKEGQIIWQPQSEYLKCRVADFANQHGIETTDWRQLINKSTADIEWFWNSFLDFADMQWSKPYQTLYDQSQGLPWTKWFIGGQTNIAYNCLDWHLSNQSKQTTRKKAPPNHPALIWENESGQKRQFTYDELNNLSGKVARLLQDLGVQAGEAVGIYMPMAAEILPVLFGCFKIGAVAVPVFSGFGPEALAKRMLDAQVKVIFTADGGKRRGKLLEIKKDVDQIHHVVPSLKHVVVLRYCQNQINWLNDCDIWFDEAINKLEPLATNYDLPAEHPCLYLYTSGTTGKPKGTIHTHAGAMAQIAKELGLVFDVAPQDKFFWLTDIGWMMGPWAMIGVAYWGGTLLIYDGAPDFPEPDRLWQFVAKYKITTLGISPTAVRVLKAESEHLIDKHDLSSLKFLGSVGEPWDYDTYMWYFNKIGNRQKPIVNISGGTELIGCLLTPLPTMPLTPCSLGSKALAMDVDVYDDNGKSLIGTIGHLVLKKPAPSLTKGFLGDSDRYLETYFTQYKNIWYHGDWAKQDKDNYWYLYGRSDDTIKIAGKRN
jgi:acetyl-CoA synthetase